MSHFIEVEDEHGASHEVPKEAKMDERPDNVTVRREVFNALLNAATRDLRRLQKQAPSYGGEELRRYLEPLVDEARSLR